MWVVEDIDRGEVVVFGSEGVVGVVDWNMEVGEGDVVCLQRFIAKGETDKALG